MSVSTLITGNELIDIVEPWIYSKLSGDAALVALVGGAQHIVGQLAPGQIAGPYVWFESTDTRDRMLVGGARLWVEAAYEVVATAQTSSYLDVKPAAARLNELMDFPPATVIEHGPGTLEIWREAPVSYAATIQGQQYRFLGGRFRVRAYYTA